MMKHLEAPALKLCSFIATHCQVLQSVISRPSMSLCCTAIIFFLSIPPAFARLCRCSSDRAIVRSASRASGGSARADVRSGGLGLRYYVYYEFVAVVAVNTAVFAAAAAAAAATAATAATVSTITITPGQVIITEVLSARLSARSAIPIKHASKFFR
jgi:hypothetical protein